MPEITLARLPERTPAKLTVSVPPDLKRALDDYAEFYRATYQQEESAAELLPAIVRAYLESDRAFVRWCRNATDRTA